MDSPIDRRKLLLPILEECRTVLSMLGKVVDENYVLKLSTAYGFRDKCRRAWERLTWVPDGIQALRSRVVLSVGLLTEFNGSLIR